LREGWQTLAPNGVEVHEIPGDHINIIKEPHVRSLAEKLSECLIKAQKEDQKAACAA
jgi:thioesterase domain-containing protein